MDKNLALKITFLAADKLSGAMKKIVGLGQTGAQKLGQMKREVRGLEREMAAVGREIGSTTGNVTQLINRERELANQIAKANGHLEKQKRLLAIDNRVAKMQARASSLKSSGQSNMIGGASVLAPLVLAGREAMMFSSGMVDIQQKAELTNAEMVKMRGNILKAAQATHQLPEDMRSAVDVLAGFGMDARQAVKLAQPIGRLGTAFKVELADGAAAAYANINNLKVPLTQTGKAFDIMAAGGNAGAFEIRDMARHFPGLTAQMRALGQHGVPAVADLTAALQIARRGSGDADEAANNVKNLLAKINAKATIKAFEKNFGVDLPAAMQAAYRKGKTPMEAIAEITNKAVGGDLKRLGFAFEDMQAQSALRMLILDMKDYKAMRADIAKADGTVNSAFGQREMQDGMVAWNSFKVMLSSTALVFGTKLLPIATQFLGVLGPMIGAIGDFATAHPQATSALLTLIATVGMAKVGLGALQFAFGSVLGPAAKAWGLFQKFRLLGGVAAAFPRFAKAAGIARTAVMFLAKGVMRAGLMMMANPVILAIVALVAVIGFAGYMIYKHWDTIKAAFWKGVAAVSGAWDWLKGKVSAAFNWWTGLQMKFLNIGKNIVLGIARGIMSAPGAVWNALKNVVTGGINNVKAMLGIKSPSRVFMAMGGHMTEVLALGVERTGRRPIRAVGKLATGVAGAMAVSSPALAAGGAAAGQTGPTFHITINQRAGEDAEALARRVADMIDQRSRVRQRGSYRDA